MKKLLAALGLYDPGLARLEATLADEEKRLKFLEMIYSAKLNKVRDLKRAIHLHREGGKVAEELGRLEYLLKVKPSVPATTDTPDA